MYADYSENRATLKQYYVTMFIDEQHQRTDDNNVAIQCVVTSMKHTYACRTSYRPLRRDL